MSGENLFRVFLGQHIPTLGRPIVIIAGVSLADWRKKFEYNILFQNDKSSFERQPYNYRPSDEYIASTRVEELDLEYLMNIVKVDASNKIQNIVDNKYQETKNDVYLKCTIKLQEAKSKKNELLRLYLQNTHNDKLEIIKKESVSKELREYLEHIFKYPTFSKEDI